MSAQRLQLGLLVGADDVLVGAQPAAFEDPGVEIQRPPGLLGNSASRGTIQERTCQGLIASSCSQRQIVDADASVTPRSMTRRCSSTREKRDNGSSCVRGNAHAIALTSATCCGGKTTRPTRPRPIAQSLKAMFGKSSSPTPDQARRGIQPPSDLGVRDTLRGVQHDPSALHILEGQLLRTRHPLKHTTLLVAELDPVTGRTRHHIDSSTPAPGSLQSFRPILPDASTSHTARPSA